VKVLVTGGAGQLGRSVAARGAAHGHEVVALDAARLDVTDPDAIDAQLARVAPGLVINAAAYTAVDRAEADRARASAVNAAAPGLLARACAARGTPVLHVSTDYVFDGAIGRDYVEDDPVSPINVYGETKAAGERAVLEQGGTVVRTSWLFAARGPSFVQTITRLAASRPQLRVVADQHGCPTWADDLADALLALAALPERAPLYHFCDAEPTTWHGFATAIVDEARRHGPLVCQRVDAITSADHPLPARRPLRAVLDTSRIRAAGIVPPPWRIGLARVVADDFRAQLAGSSQRI
jgi:dTDP-4-dehydrorhamnose reductase